MKVLVVKLSSLGDVVHTLPALSDAAAALPGIRFDWVVEEGFADVPPWHGAVDTVIPVALRRWRKRPLRDLRSPEARRAYHALRRRRYDAVIDAQGLLKSAVIARLVDAPRYGMDWHSARERLATGVYHHAIRVPRDLHAVERVRVLFARALAYSLPTGRADYGVRVPQGSPEAGGGDLVFLHGTARNEKLWPEEHWQALAALAVARGYRICLPWGTALEEERARRIAARVNAGSAPGAVRVLPRLTLSQLAILLRHARAAVAVDTGLGHLAAALDLPTVSLYGPTRSNLVGTCGAHQVHLQSALRTRGNAGAQMASIAPTQVWDALQPLLAPTAQRPHAAGGD